MANYPYTVPGDQAFMGKARTYSEQTQFRQQAVRLRALVDNPRNPNIVGAIGSDWAVDDPSAIVEEGSDANGNYVIYAGGKKQVSFEKSNPPVGSFSFVFPIVFENIPRIDSYFLKNSSQNWHTGFVTGENFYINSVTVSKLNLIYSGIPINFLTAKVSGV